MKIRPLGGELFHADGRTDMTKLIVALRSFENVPKIYIHDQRFYGDTPRYTIINSKLYSRSDFESI
jgi:hypothetical protein